MIVEFLTVIHIILGYVIVLLTIIQPSTSAITDPNVLPVNSYVQVLRSKKSYLLHGK